MKKEKVIVFIEGSNIYFAQKKMGRWLDWVKVKRFLDKNYKVIEIRYYVGLRKDDQKIKPFLSKLKRVGFKIITKTVKIIIDEAGKKIEKANFDVEITGDVLSSQNEFQAAIFFSGDSDFDYLIKLLHKRSKKAYVYSSKKTLSWELKLSTDKYFFLENLLELTKGKQFVKL